MDEEKIEAMADHEVEVSYGGDNPIERLAAVTGVEKRKQSLLTLAPAICSPKNREGQKNGPRTSSRAISIYKLASSYSNTSSFRSKHQKICRPQHTTAP
jgi:hypothetical protein